MAYITTFTVTNSAAVEITAVTNCVSIMVGESTAVSGFPTTAYLVTKNIGSNVSPTASSSKQMIAGASYSFTNPFNAGGRSFQAGDVAGWVQLISGASSTTFIQDEG